MLSGLCATIQGSCNSYEDNHGHGHAQNHNEHMPVYDTHLGSALPLKKRIKTTSDRSQVLRLIYEYNVQLSNCILKLVLRAPAHKYPPTAPAYFLSRHTY